MPRRYASITVAGSTSAPSARRSPSGHSDTRGSCQRLFPTGCGAESQLVISGLGQLERLDLDVAKLDVLAGALQSDCARLEFRVTRVQHFLTVEHHDEMIAL